MVKAHFQIKADNPMIFI